MTSRPVPSQGRPAGWAEHAAQALVETFEGSSEAEGVAVAAAGVDDTATAIRISPDGTPRAGRFEIGSVTKTMTATMLALLAAEGRLGLDDEAGRWLSAGANGSITVRQLATHTSGLPRLAPDFFARHVDPDNPWAGFTFEQAEEGLRRAAIAPGRPWLYSNLGYQLLGLVLERATGQDYATLITDRLLRPLGMTASCVGPDGGGIPLPGHAHGRQARRWDQPLGAGGVEATIGDLARYARACLHPPPTPLGAAITAAQAPQVRIDQRTEQALGWKVHDGHIRGHTGGTGGFSSCVMVDPRRRRAVAMLVSQSGLAAAAMPNLTEAGLLALAGSLPALASPQAPWPGWEHDARDIAQPGCCLRGTSRRSMPASSRSCGH